jgi:hypothetical protein
VNGVLVADVTPPAVDTGRGGEVNTGAPAPAPPAVHAVYTLNTTVPVGGGVPAPPVSVAVSVNDPPLPTAIDAGATAVAIVGGGPGLTVERFAPVLKPVTLPTPGTTAVPRAKPICTVC